MRTTSLKHKTEREPVLRGRDHDEAMAELYREEPDFAVAVLNSILEDGDDQGELLILLRQMAKAFGGVSAVAERANLNHTQLYRTLSKGGNPSLRSLVAILRSMGLQLEVKSIQQKQQQRKAA